MTFPLAVDRWLTFPSAVDRWLTSPSAVDRWLTSSTYRFPLGEDLGEAAGRFRGGLFNFQLSTFNFLPLIAPRSIGSLSTEHRLTLHGESAHSPRRIGLLSTLCTPTSHVKFATYPRDKSSACSSIMYVCTLLTENAFS